MWVSSAVRSGPSASKKPPALSRRRRHVPQRSLRSWSTTHEQVTAGDAGRRSHRSRSGATRQDRPRRRRSAATPATMTAIVRHAAAAADAPPPTPTSPPRTRPTSSNARVCRAACRAHGTAATHLLHARRKRPAGPGYTRTPSPGRSPQPANGGPDSGCSQVAADRSAGSANDDEHVAATKSTAPRLTPSTRPYGPGQDRPPRCAPAPSETARRPSHRSSGISTRKPRNRDGVSYPRRARGTHNNVMRAIN